MSETAPTPDGTPATPDPSAGDPGNQVTITLPSGVVVGDPNPDRPGGPSLSDQVAELRTQIETLTGKRDEVIGDRQEAKGKVSDAQAQIDALTATVNKLAGQLTATTVTDLARNAGAKDPAVVAALVKDTDNPQEAIEAMRKSHSFMFGTRTPSADMGSGDTLDGGTGPKTELGKYLTDNFT